jgi:hypothetical protein
LKAERIEMRKIDNEMFLFTAKVTTTTTTVDAFSKNYIAQVEFSNIQFIHVPYF